jgi:multiple sugar transport system permease protein
MHNHATRRKGLTESQFGFLLVVPALTVFCFIILYPFINTIKMSFTNQSMLRSEASFVGFDNYIKIFSDPNFLGVLNNTLIFVVIGTLAPFVLGFIWAMVLNQGMKGSGLLRGLTLVDWIIPSTAIGFLWLWIFHGEYGVLNYILMKLNLVDANVNWMGKTTTAMAVVLIAKTWQTLPWFMVYLLGGLQGVPHEQIEAARIDGAGNWKVLTHIVLPEMKFIISLVLILGTISSLQHFDLIWIMTQGGPARATTTLAVEVYRAAFQSWDLGTAAAIGFIWVSIMSVFTYFYLRSMKEDLL